MESPASPPLQDPSNSPAATSFPHDNYPLLMKFVLDLINLANQGGSSTGSNASPNVPLPPLTGLNLHPLPFNPPPVNSNGQVSNPDPSSSAPPPANTFTPGYFFLPQLAAMTPSFIPIPLGFPATPNATPAVLYGSHTPGHPQDPVVPPLSPSPVIPPTVPPPTAPCWHSNTPATTPLVLPSLPPCQPLPVRASFSTEMQVHTDLVPNLMDPARPSLRWNTSYAPDTAHRVTPDGLYVKPRFRDTALHPQAKKVLIAIQYAAAWPWPWGPILVEKRPPVRVKDVLDAIYDYLQTPLTWGEYESFEASGGPDFTSQLANYMHQRVRSSHQAVRSVERSQGLKRIDVLGPWKFFRGLTPILFSNGTWMLYLRLDGRNKFP